MTNLEFLNTGNVWPPEGERYRLDLYSKNKQLFENEHAEVYKEAFRRIERVIGNFQQVISYPIVINYQKKISLKTADLLLGEEPKITAGDDGTKEQKTVRAIIDNGLIPTLFETIIDVTRYGDGILYVYKDENGGKIDVSQTNMWFPVVSPDNVKKIDYHVIAWTYDIGDNKYLKIQIHSKGSYEERIHKISKSANISDTIGDRISLAVKSTGLDDFAIIQIPNVITSDRVYGYDDYTDVDSIIAEILIRTGQIARILDKHASPSVQGPMSALEQDPITKEWKLKLGGYFGKDSKDDAGVEYITWDGQLEASFKQIEILINALSVISEMGTALFDTSERTGEAASGTALRLRYISPLAKVKRIAMNATPKIKKALQLCSQLGGKNIVNLTDSDISITWQDGLPNDDTEISNIIKSRTGDQQTMSVKRALMQYDQMSNDDADAEIELIDEESTKANPFAGQNPFGNMNNNDQGGDQDVQQQGNEEGQQGQKGQINNK